MSLYPNPGYKPEDFAAVLRGPATPNIFFVRRGVPAKTPQELMALARTKPMSSGSSRTGATPHLVGELLFRTLGKPDVTHVPIGPAQAATAVAGGQVPIGSTSMSPAVPLIKAPRLRPLAVTRTTRSARSTLPTRACSVPRPT